MKNLHPPEDCSIFETDDFKQTRRAIIFPIFVNNTNEKNQNLKVSSYFLDSYLPGLINNVSCVVNDLGVGNGDLSYKVAQYLHGKCENNIINYYGIDQIESFAQLTKSKLSTLDFVNNTIIHGNCFSDDIDKLATKPTLLIASQVLFYLNEADFNNFINMVIQRLGLVAIIITQADGSFLNKIGKNYDNSNKQVDTESKLEQTLNQHKLKINHIKILYDSSIYLPSNLSLLYLKEIAQANFDSLKTSSESFKIRALLEFVAGTPLERLACLNKTKLDYFIEDINNHLKLNQGQIKFWNYMSITVPTEHMNQSSMQQEWLKIQNLTLSGNLKAFEAAIKESNYDIALAISRQGLTSCALNYYKESFSTQILQLIRALFWHELSLSEIKEVLKFFNIQTNNFAQYQNYSSFELLRMQEVKDHYNIIYPKITGISTKANNFRTWVFDANYTFSSIALYPFLYEFFWSFHLITPFLIITAPFISSLLALNMIIMFTYFYKQYFNTGSTAIDFIQGDNFLLQIYLYDQNNYPRLILQDHQWQNALHKAIIQDDYLKIINLLSCSNNLVQNMINTYDINGFFPLHYASMKNQKKIVQILLEKNFDINTKATISTLDYLFNAIFILNKGVYVYIYFVTGFSLKNSSIFKNIALLVPYFVAKIFDLNFPDGFYLLSFLHRFDSYNHWNQANIKQIYYEYSQNTALHLSTYYNHSELTEYLLANNANVNIFNAKGETPLHFAAANNNLALITSLTQSGADINSQTHYREDYPILDLLVKFSLLYFSTNNLFSTLSEAIFLTIFYYEIVNLPSIAIGATPLHYALTDINQTQHNNSNVPQETTVRYLIENGANPNLPMYYYNQVSLQIIPYILSKLTITITKLQPCYSLPVLVFYQLLFPYYGQGKKPIDLASGHIYQYLKQYTVQNEFSDNKGIIEMKEYGIYQGGFGKDIFNLHCNSLNKQNNYHFIIQDFNIGDDELNLYNCTNNSKIEYKESLVMNQSSTILCVDDELLVFLGIEKDNIKDININFL